MSGASASAVIAYVAANVRRARLRRGLTQEELAEAAGVDLTYLQRIERGTANPSVRVLVSIANALDVPPSRLFRKARMPQRRRGRPPGRQRRSTATRKGSRPASA
jgi:transcriptional regulator with XRE-family HTH domain